MRFSLRVAITAMALWASVAGASEGEYCAIPRLVAGVPVRVPVHDMNSFCGVAVIEGKYVQLKDMRKVESNAVCDRTGRCQRTVSYFPSANAWPAYIVVLENKS